MEYDDITDEIHRRISELMTEGVISTTVSFAPTTLTMEGMRAMIDGLKPVLYYVVDGRVVDEGFIVRVKGGLFNPFFIVIHPENEDEYLKALSKEYRCVPAKDEPAEERVRRTMKYYQGVQPEWLP